ncbi:MAG: integration host factor, alpha subunit [Pseudomonadota bacterium]|jgi:integration host factor subunit alpha
MSGTADESANTLTRAGLTEAVAERLDVQRRFAATLVDDVITLISEATLRGQNVKIVGFGSFNLRDKRSRPGRNPRTMQDVTITARRVLTFRASPALRSALNPRD